MICASSQDFFENMNCHFIRKLDLMNQASDNLEGFLSSPDTTLPAEMDDALWAKLSASNSKVVFGDARFVTEATVSLRDACTRIAGISADCLFSKPGVHRARLLLQSFTAIVCMWRPLKEGERRSTVMTGCKHLLANSRFYGSCQP